jgi:hypothetical protein
MPNVHSVHMHKNLTSITLFLIKHGDGEGQLFYVFNTELVQIRVSKHENKT